MSQVHAAVRHIVNTSDTVIVGFATKGRGNKTEALCLARENSGIPVHFGHQSGRITTRIMDRISKAMDL